MRMKPGEYLNAKFKYPKITNDDYIMYVSVIGSLSIEYPHDYKDMSFEEYLKLVGKI